MMAIDWSLAARPDPNQYLGPLQAMAAGRQAALETRRAAARQAALGQAAQGDLEGAQHTALAGGDTETADYVREAQARASAGQVIGMYGTPGASTGAPATPQSPVQSLIAAGTPGAPPAPNLAHGAVDPLAPLPAAAPSPMADHMHDTAVAIGHAATSGQPADPTQAWSHLYALDPVMGDKMMTAVASMDTLRKNRLAETTDALANAAQSLLSVPPEQRAAAAQQMLPMLAAHGVTADQLTAANLSDQGLKGIIGQSLGVKGMLDQANKGRELDQTDTRNVEEARHNLVTERQAGIKTMQPGEEIVDTGGAGVGGTQAVGGFDHAVATVLHNEGGYNPSDMNGAPVNFGINQKANPGVDVKNMTREQAVQIYHDKYWVPSGAEKLPANMQTPYFDVYVRNPAIAKRALAASGGDPARFADITSAYFQRLTTKPGNEKYAHPYADRDANNRAIALGTSTGPRVIASNNTNTLSDDAAESAAAIYVRTGQLPAGVARTKGDIDKILNVAAQMQKAVGSKPGDIATNWQDYKSQSKAVSAFASGQLGTQVRTMNVAVDHLSALAGSVEALKNGNTPLFNKLSNAVASATGKPAPTNFNALRDFVLDEVTKAIIGGGGTGGDRDKAQGLISAAQSPDQLYGAIGQVQRLMSGQLGGLRQQYETSTGRKDFERFLSPNTIRTLEQHGHSSASAMPSGFRIVGRTPK